MPCTVVLLKSSVSTVRLPCFLSLNDFWCIPVHSMAIFSNYYLHLWYFSPFCVRLLTVTVGWSALSVSPAHFLPSYLEKLCVRILDFCAWVLGQFLVKLAWCLPSFLLQSLLYFVRFQLFLPQYYHCTFHGCLISYIMQALRFSRRWLWRITFSGILRRVTLVITDVLEEDFASIIKVTKIVELGTTLAVTSNRSGMQRNNIYCSIFS
jgi:hypothetical protein